MNVHMIGPQRTLYPLQSFGFAVNDIRTLATPSTYRMRERVVFFASAHPQLSVLIGFEVSTTRELFVRPSQEVTATRSTI